MVGAAAPPAPGEEAAWSPMARGAAMVVFALVAELEEAAEVEGEVLMGNWHSSLQLRSGQRPCAAESQGSRA